jgi:hypothetical protein
MTTYTHTSSTRRAGHLRAYLAGAGATAALTAGALVVFLSLAAFVAFNGFPFGGFGDGDGEAFLGSSPSGAAAPVTAAAALRGAHAAVARDPLHGSRAPGSGSGGGHGAGGGSNPAGAGPSDGGGNPPGGGWTDPGGSGKPSGGPLPSSTSGPVSQAVQGVDNAAGTNLSGPTGGVTGAVDGAATGAVNQVGGAVGPPHLGDQVGGAVSGATDPVLGGGHGSGDGLLGG